MSDGWTGWLEEWVGEQPVGYGIDGSWIQEG